MFITMHCMGIPFDGNTIKEKSLGGSETAAYYMAKELAAQGHKVTLFTGSPNEGDYDGVRYLFYGQPNQDQPLGDRFHFFAQNTPHDVLIIQRHPHAFRFPFAAKIKLWWVHDLAIMRKAGEVQSQLWNMTGVLTVSEFHKKQICEVYGLEPNKVHAIQNGIDLSLFEGRETEMIMNNPSTIAKSRLVRQTPDGTEDYSKRINLLYTSRPERGLEHLVCPNGIMERLAKIDTKYHLYVCGYDNTTEQMRPYYEQLWQACEILPNVTNLGNLTKQELADVMRQCDALVYPTPGPLQPDFEEVSCITAMECMAAGLPFISSKAGALEETCNGSGAILLDLASDGLPDINAFVNTININMNPDMFSGNRKQMKKSAPKFAWSRAAAMLDDIMDKLMEEAHTSDGAILRDLIRNGDIYAAKEYSKNLTKTLTGIKPACLKELNDCYQFAFQNKWKEHYEAYYEYEKNRGINYGPERLDGNNRYDHVAGLVDSFPAGISVLDYGCAHGHYTVNLAKRCPDKKFIGIDIEATNIEKARAWAKDEGLSNVEFFQGHVTEEGILSTGQPPDRALGVDCIIAAEVLEHVESPQHVVDSLAKYMNDGGLFVLTTPYGPWEYIGAEQHWPWRAHVHHFDRADLFNMFGHHKNYSVNVAPSGSTKWAQTIGSYITTFGKPTAPSETIDYQRKFERLAPLQTVSLCMIVYNAEETLLRTLNSVADVVDEIVIAVDPKTNDGTLAVIESFTDSRNLWPVVKIIDGFDPLEAGFDEARNHSIKEASGDWIMWLDSDEILVHADNIYKYLHNNMFDGYALQQHHFAVQPLGVMKTDLPVRLFRNHRGIRFFGVVHEHPEKDINKGAGYVQVIQDLEIAHQGYTTEAIRRKRFHRNINLMVRDREKYPKRQLGKFLWIRDLAQMCQYELEHNGGHITPEMHKRADEGIRLWEELLEENQLRMLVDGIQFYSTLSQIKGDGFEFAFMLDSSKLNGGTHLEQARPIKAHFAKREHIDKLFNKLTDEKVKDYDSRYF